MNVHILRFTREDNPVSYASSVPGGEYKLTPDIQMATMYNRPSASMLAGALATVLFRTKGLVNAKPTVITRFKDEILDGVDDATIEVLVAEFDVRTRKVIEKSIEVAKIFNMKWRAEDDTSRDPVQAAQG